MEQGQRSDPGHDQADRGTYQHPALPPPISEPWTPQAGSALDAAEPARVIEILSHELRSPITTIHLGTKVLRDAGSRISGPVRLEVVEAVEEEAERLYRLVEDLLAVARHEGGAAPLPVAPLAIQRWLPDTIAAEVRAYPALVVRSSIPHDLPPVLVDDGGFAHVVRNLLANAVRYAPRGMPVEIVATVPQPGVVRLEFLDRGPGVNAAEADHLFDPFYRTQSATLQGSGAGLGLAAARRLLGAMNATIEALPREGGGARFVITLPVAPADAEPESDRPTAS